MSILIIQKSVEPQMAHRFATPKVLLTAITLALVCFVVFRYVPAIWGNLIWASAIVVVLLVPMSRAYVVLSREQGG